jgi:hypothetical protein
MNLEKEILELNAYFKNGGIITRILLGVGFFLTLSSITSLSSKIIEWKGFILDGINFYQSYFVNPISSIAASVGLNYTEIEIHAATATSACIITGMRLLATGQKAVFQSINEKYNSELKPSMIMYWSIAVASPIGIWSWYGIADPTIRVWLLIILMLIYPLFLILPKIYTSKNRDDCLDENYFKYIKGYYAYMGSFALVIAILAAINIGIQEKEPNKSRWEKPISPER